MYTPPPSSVVGRCIVSLTLLCVWTDSVGRTRRSGRVVATYPSILRVSSVRASVLARLMIRPGSVFTAPNVRGTGSPRSPATSTVASVTTRWPARSAAWPAGPRRRSTPGSRVDPGMWSRPITWLPS